MSPLVIILTLISLLFPYSLSLTSDTAYHIDCGGPTTTKDPFGTTWLSDRYFTGGASSVVSEPLRFSLQPEKTLRFFPPTTSGKKNCYIVPVPPGRYLFRTFTVYDNYDGKSRPPSFEVSVTNTVVFSFRSPWLESLSREGSYSDLIAFVNGTDPTADVCFYSIATDPPVIATLEVIGIDLKSYSGSNLGPSVLVNYGRLTCGQNQWGPGLSNDTDFFGRSWQSDEDFRSGSTKGVQVISTTTSISGANVSPNYFPAKLYQVAVTVSKGVLEYELSVDAKLDYLIWFHFAEIDPKVTKAGQRVFDVLVNGVNVNRIDVFKGAGGGFRAYDWHFVAKNLSSTTLSVRLNPVVGSPILCGLENYAIVPNDLATVPDQVMAMRALKDSLRVPDRMGWNGDPCAPTSWDAWEGVTCHTNKDGDALVIAQIELASQGLKGFISDKISLLTNLASLNLSSNSLGGPLPDGLGQKSLVRLDLSNNEFTGAIPESFASSTNLRLVLLNDNQLEGQVPEQIYSVGVHGGAIDLSGNKGLCGVPSLPECPLFWHNGRLSNGGKVAIGISVGVFLMVLLLVIYICIRRKKNDYDFGFPHELMSMSAKRNRYQRQKSLMVLEMESQHAKGLIPTLNPQ